MTSHDSRRDTIVGARRKYCRVERQTPIDQKKKGGNHH